jgi:hypothetical protein
MINDNVDSIEPVCANCLYCAPFNRDGWCEIHKSPVSKEFNCDYFMSLEI